MIIHAQRRIFPLLAWAQIGLSETYQPPGFDERLFRIKRVKVQLVVIASTRLSRLESEMTSLDWVPVATLSGGVIARAGVRLDWTPNSQLGKIALVYL